MSGAVARIRSALGDPRIIRAVVLFVSAGVLLYLSAIFWFGWQDTATALASLGLNVLLLGAVLSSSSYLWRFGRWESALRCFGYRVPAWRHLAIYLSGLGLTATPGKTGETFRSALLLQQGVRIAHSLAAFIVDRASDVLGMCLLGFVAAGVLGHALAWAWLLAFAVLLSGSCVFAWFLRHPRAGAWWGWLGRAWQRLPVKGGQAILEHWASVWKLPRVTAYSTLATVAYGTQALVFAWFCDAAGTGVPVAACVLIFVQATLFGAASMSPGGLGAMEAALVIQLTEHSVDGSVAVSIAIAIRLVTLWLGMAIGAMCLLISSRKAAA
ncbi:lysylphosphatidylglycerol synthase transmembrane domain-containing protein [Pseudoduganella sp. HUAS MS19]